MYLVPEEVMTLIRQQYDIQTSPLVKSMSSLSQQMSNTLSDPNQPAEIKIKNHDQLLHRYLNLQEQRESYVPTVKLQTAEAIAPPQVTQPPPQGSHQQGQPQSLSESEILETVPKTFRSQAENLLRWIKKTPEAVRWDDMGQVLWRAKPSKVRVSLISSTIPFESEKDSNPLEEMHLQRSWPN